MSFQMSSFGAPPNPYQMPANYTPASGSQTPRTQHVANGDMSGIYMAAYSGISVYEMMVNGINVMRRRNDSWLNATQILKVAGVEKGKRTKVLEKEILPGKHEKVQGGYGKYQGTWVEYERGRDFCRQYGVEELIRPLLEYDMGPDGQGRGKMDTPTKEQAMAAQRKKKLSENRISTASPNGTFFKNISSSAANAVQAINKARFESPASRPGSAQKPRATLGRTLSQQQSTQDSFQPSSQQSLASIHSERSMHTIGQPDHSFGRIPNPYLSQGKRPASGLGVQEPPRKRMRSESSSHTITPAMNGFSDSSMTIGGEIASHIQGSHTDALGVPPLPTPSSTSALRKRAALLSLLMIEDDDDIVNHPTFDEITGQDLDIPMDNSGHTALIWAATLARIPLVRKLVTGGVNIFRVNVGGETALMRAASAVNNYERGSFPELLDILGPTIEMRDGRGRTVLHYIAIASAIKGRSRACKYYLESLLEFVVRQGSGLTSANSSQNAEAGGALTNGNVQKQKTIGLARFMSEIVNAQDVSGDTALNMAARNGNRALAQQLLEVGADASIANNGGLKPTDFGVEGLSSDDTHPQLDDVQGVADSLGSMGPPPSRKINSKVAEYGAEMLSSLQAIIENTKSGFAAESQAKQQLIDDVRKKLGAAQERLKLQKERVKDLRRRKAARKDLHNQILNLRRANEEGADEIRTVTHSQPKTQVKLGDADAGLWINHHLLPPQQQTAAHVNETNGEIMDIDPAPYLNGDLDHVDLGSLTPDQYRYASSNLPQSRFLKARLEAYLANNDSLREENDKLVQKSSLLESQVKTMIALSMGVTKERLPELLPGIMTAVESEPGDMDMNRVRELLRRVQEDEDEHESERE